MIPGGERKQVSYLNQYTGYFTSPEGDIPITVVANSMKEAAKILNFPGVFGEDAMDPAMIKFVKGKIAVAAAVKTVGFNTIITPQGAIDSGAYATPAHAEVTNGTEVIFTAYEPYSWNFVGWYKNDQLISTDKVTTIDIYDPYSTLLQYEARYVFDETRILRDGRYLELGRGWVIDLKFSGYSNYKGRMIINTSSIGDYCFIIENYDDTSITLKPDPLVTQPEQIVVKFNYEATPIGLVLTVQEGVTVDNILSLNPGSVLSLKWTSDLKVNC
jgi:hypothetical protein